MKRDDRLWKGILENVCDDFLLFFFKEAETVFDLEKGFQFLDKELEQLFPIEDSEAPKFVDKLVKVFTRLGNEEWILVHIEVQGYDDKDFAKRMFTYFYRILDRYGKPVTALAIFTDSNRKFHPRSFEYDFLGTKNVFSFNTYKVIEQDETGLLQDSNPFAMVILTVLLSLKSRRLEDEDLLKLKYSLAKNLLAKKIARKKIDDILIFLKLYVTFADSKYNVKFDSAIEELTENQTTMGIRELVLDLAKKDGLKKGREEGLVIGMEEGIEKGIEQGIEKGIEQGIERGKAEVVKNLLATGKFTILEIANFASVSEIFVLEVKKSLSE